MAPAPGTLLGMLGRSVKTLQKYYTKASKAVQSQVSASTQAELQAIPIRNTPRHPLHPAAYLRQNKGRYYTTHSAINATTNSARQFGTKASDNAPSGVKYIRSSFPKSTVGATINRSTGRAPFASTLRPNLTGGTFGRTAGGYGTAGGARYFSHTPASPAQVVQNVSQAVRAFLISGKKAQYDGTEPISGGKRYKAVSALEKETSSKMSSLPKATPGSFIDFTVNPTITALTPLGAVVGYTAASTTSAKSVEHLNTEGLLDVLSADFSRALKDLAVILNDLKKLSALGDLPITYNAASSALRIHFPGVDAETVTKLCDEMGVQRGFVGQDEDFDNFVGTDIALLFPFAPSKTVSECSFYEKPVHNRTTFQDRINWQTMQDESDVVSEAEYSTQSDAGLGFEHDAEVLDELDENPWISSPSGYESLRTSDIESSGEFAQKVERGSPLEYQGFEGIYRFVEMCDDRRH